MEAVGLSVIVAVVAPVFHKYVPPPLAVSVAASPWQIFDEPEMDALGAAFTFTVAVVVLEQLPLETVTV